MKINIQSEDLINILKKEEYKPKHQHLTKQELEDKEYLRMEESNCLFSIKELTLIEDYFEKYNRLITPTEFTELCYNHILSKLLNREIPITFNWNKAVEKGLKNRLLRTYISFIIELHTCLLLKEMFPESEIIKSAELDLQGIDILLKEKSIEHKIHITKHSPYAIDYLLKKEGLKIEFKKEDGKLYSRPIHSKVQNEKYAHRDFSGHTFLLYDGFNSDTTQKINGYFLFRKEYLLNKIQVDTLRKLRAS